MIRMALGVSRVATAILWEVGVTSTEGATLYTKVLINNRVVFDNTVQGGQLNASGGIPYTDYDVQVYAESFAKSKSVKLQGVLKAGQTWLRLENATP